MASLAIVKVRFTESALAVVATHAGLRPRSWEMLRRESRADLASLRRAASRDRVTAIAVEVLARAVVRVAEADVERARLCAGRRGASGPVASAAS